MISFQNFRKDHAKGKDKRGEKIDEVGIILFLTFFVFMSRVKKWCRVAQLWCGVAQLAARRLAVRQARVRFSARHHREVISTEHTSDGEMERGFSEWRRMNVRNE